MRLLEGRTGLEDVSGKRRRTIAELIDVGCGVQARPWSRERMPRAAVPQPVAPPLSVEAQDRDYEEKMAAVDNYRVQGRERPGQIEGKINTYVHRPGVDDKIWQAGVASGDTTGHLGQPKAKIKWKPLKKEFDPHATRTGRNLRVDL